MRWDDLSRIALRPDKTYMKYSRWPRRLMLYSPLDATPPTVAIWTTLANYYIYLGTAAGVVVTAYMLYYIMKNRAKPGRQAPAFHEEIGGTGKGSFCSFE